MVQFVAYKTRSVFADLVFLYGGNTSYPIPPAILALGTIGNCSTWFKNTILGFSAVCVGLVFLSHISYSILKHPRASQIFKKYI